MATLKDEELYSGLEGNQPVVYAVKQIILLSPQCCRDFETGKLACNVICFYINYIEHVKRFENNITSMQVISTDVNVFTSSLTI